MFYVDYVAPNDGLFVPSPNRDGFLKPGHNCVPSVPFRDTGTVLKNRDCPGQTGTYGHLAYGIHYLVRAGVRESGIIVQVYTSIVGLRSVMEYACPVWHPGLTAV